MNAHESNAAPETLRRGSRFRAILFGIAATVAVFTLAAVLIRYSVPHLDRFRPEIEALLSKALGQDVSVGVLKARWVGLSIELSMRDLKVIERDAGSPVVHLNNARLTIDPLASLRAGELTPGDLTIAGASFAITRKADGTFSAAGGGSRSPGADSTAPGDSPNPDVVVRWLLRQGALRLESATVIWHDLGRGRDPIRVTDVNLYTRFHDNRHRIEGSVSLPTAMGNRLAFELQVTDNPMSADWSGTVRLLGQGIRLAPLARTERSPVQVLDGLTSFSVTSRWEGAKLQTADGELSVAGATLAAGRSREQGISGSSRFALKRDGGGWQLGVDELRVSTKRGEWTESSARIDFLPEQGSPRLSVRASLGFVALGDVVPIVTGLLASHGVMAPSMDGVAGSLRNLRLTSTLAPGKLDALSLQADVVALSTPSHGTLPGVGPISGRLDTDLRRGALVFDNAPLHLVWPGASQDGLRAASVSGGIRWIRRGTGWWLESDGVEVANTHATVSFAGHAHWPFGNSDPILDLRMHVAKADLTRLETYLPVHLLRPRVKDWLQRAIQAGQLANGEVYYRGRGSHFPFEGVPGSLGGDATITAGGLEYAPQWPALEALSADVSLRGPELAFRINDGRVSGAHIRSAEVQVADVRDTQPTVVIHGEVRGEARMGLKFLRESPLQEKFGHLVKDVKASGRMRAQIVSRVPIGGKKIAHGTIHLEDNQVEVPRMQIVLGNVNGALSFDSEGVSAERIDAIYLHQPVALNVARAPGLHRVTRIRMAGRADRDMLRLQLSKYPLLARAADALGLRSQIAGETRFSATLDIPDQWGKDDSSASLLIESPLSGLGLDVPSPLGKAISAARPLRIHAALTNARTRTVDIRYGEGMSGIFVLTRAGDRYRFDRGSVMLGGEQATIPEDDGLHVTGRLDALSLDSWTTLLTAPRPTPGGPEEADSMLGRFNSVDVGTAELTVLGNTFTDTRVDLSRSPAGGWRIDLQGEAVSGTVTVPENTSENPIVADFDRLTLDRPAQRPEASQVDPKQIPAIRFSCDSLRFEGIHLGSLELSTSPQPFGLRINSLRVASRSFESRTVGTWSFDAGRHSSQLVTELQGNDLGELLSTLGYDGDAATGGATEIVLNAAWDGPPSEFSLRNLSGILHFRANDGRLADVDPGTTGRMFGLFTLSSLPRRLKLDFSDLFAKGLAYKLIEGSFAIQGGNAYTNDLVMEGESARIDVAGRTGLVEKDYDQIVTVTPKLASSLPLAPIWLIEKVFRKRAFDKVFAYQYSVTGSWDDPVIERLIAEGEPPDSG